MSEDCIILDTPELKRETNSIHKQPELNDYFENYTACGSVLKVEFRRHNEEEIVVFTLQKSNIDHQYFTIKI